MIPWSAYAPRRARDPIAWLTVKGVTSREGLSAELSSLGIDPASFPEALICQHLEALRSNQDPEPMECSAPSTEVEGASNDAAPAAPRRTKRKGWSSNSPT